MSTLMSLGSETAFRRIAIAIVGLALFVTPWVFDYETEALAAWSSWFVGAAAVLIAALAILAHHQFEEWASLALGAWTMIAPWTLNFAAHAEAVCAHVAAGLVVSAIAAGMLRNASERPLNRQSSVSVIRRA